MKLKTVTMTGADDRTQIKELVKISKEYPFVEWGVLLSKSQEGSNRFPSRKWIVSLNEEINYNEIDIPVQTSAHLCGRWVRDLLKGEINCEYFGLELFDRVQLNFHSERHNFSKNVFVKALKKLQDSYRTIIFQLDNVNNNLLEKVIESGIPAQGLFDKSGGAGIVPSLWPAPSGHFECGYAGGLGPDNLRQELERINDMAGESQIWIDMETKVRSNHDMDFDLDKVVKCLEISKEFM